MTKKNPLEDVPLTNEQHNLLLGSLHGDMRVEQNGRYHRCIIDHSIKQKAYVEWKHSKLSPFSLDIREFENPDKKRNKVYEKIKFATNSLSLFSYYFHLAYDEFFINKKKKTKKVVKKEFIDKFTSPDSLAVWFMDDGSLRSDGQSYRLHTESCCPLEIELWQQCLWKNFSLRATPQKHGTGQLLSFPVRGEEGKKFETLVKEYIVKQVPSMKSKLYKSI